jgi:predicted ArsR family transcriptional regulator
MQMTLDTPRVRRNDPDSSCIAAARAERFAGTHCERIMAVLGAKEMTAGEIGAACGLTVVQVDRRMHELEKLGKVKRYKTRFCTTTGATMMTWRAV